MFKKRVLLTLLLVTIGQLSHAAKPEIKVEAGDENLISCTGTLGDSERNVEIKQYYTDDFTVNSDSILSVKVDGVEQNSLTNNYTEENIYISFDLKVFALKVLDQSQNVILFLEINDFAPKANRASALIEGEFSKINNLSCKITSRN